MKTILLSLRFIGVLFGLFMLYNIFGSLHELLTEGGPMISPYLISVLFSSYIPFTITFLLLLLPFSRIASTQNWWLAFGVMSIGLIYWSIEMLLAESFSSSLFFSTLALSQVCAIFIYRPFRSNTAEQGAAANP